MGLAEFERKKDEKINGVVYDMSPSPHFTHIKMTLGEIFEGVE